MGCNLWRRGALFHEVFHEVLGARAHEFLKVRTLCIHTRQKRARCLRIARPAQ